MSHMELALRIWRQEGPDDRGKFVDYNIEISPDASFLEMLDVLNEQLANEGQDPIAFDHDCREGICGMCSLVINGTAHGPEKATTTCQLHMRKFAGVKTITVEPWRARAFPWSKI